MPHHAIPLLQSLLLQAEAARDAASGLLRQTEQQMQQARQQGDGLQQYRSEQDQRWVARLRQATVPELLHCQRSFGQRLDQAIDLQDRTTLQLDQRVSQARQALLAREQKVAAVRKLIERRQADQRRSADRQAQHLSDETAQRSHGGRQPLAPPTTI